jgi:hypothetical protein
LANPPPIGGQDVTVFVGQWSYIFVAFFIGFASGFRSIYEKFASESIRVLWTWSGFFYSFSRGLIPVAVYLIWRHFKESGHDSFFSALWCGFGSELFLRSRIYFGERKTPKGNIELSKGLFDLVKWYQFLLLKNSGEILADERRKFNEKLMMGQTDFLKLCSRARVNAKAWPIDTEKKGLLELIGKFQKDFESESKDLSGDVLQEVHKRFIFEFGYAAMLSVRRKSLKTLIA